MKRYDDFIKKTALNNEYREECLRKAEYYKLWNNHTAKFSNWTGPQYYEIRAHQERSVREQEEKKTQLTIRRQRLAEKLHQETLLHNAELREVKKKQVISTKELKLRHNELLEKLDADAKSEAELQLSVHN
ncbi:hypothetical protein B566_EDAN011788 [Ephemera danica]|nr:hypothetical protein B566_EDAN011788 [Ephemera danica]